MNTLTAPSFGMRRIWKENPAGSYSITTIAVFISRWMGARLLKLAADIHHYLQNWVTIRGYQTATDFFRHQLLRALRIRPGQAHVSPMIKNSQGLVVGEIRPAASWLPGLDRETGR